MSHDGLSDAQEGLAMDLCVETLTGLTLEVKAYPTDTVLDIKNKIQRVEGIPVQHQNLLFHSKEVEDHNRLCDLGVINGSSLKLVLSMRGGPISTRRLSTCDHRINWKDLEEIIEHTRDEISDKLGPGAKVSVLVFKDGDVINLVRVIKNDPTTIGQPQYQQSPQVEPSPGKEQPYSLFYNRLRENKAMLTKLTDLRKKMSDLSIRRNLKNSKPVESETVGSPGWVGQNRFGGANSSKWGSVQESQLDFDVDEASGRDETRYDFVYKLLEDCNDAVFSLRRRSEMGQRERGSELRDEWRKHRREQYRASEELPPIYYDSDEQEEREADKLMSSISVPWLMPLQAGGGGGLCVAPEQVEVEPGSPSEICDIAMAADPVKSQNGELKEHKITNLVQSVHFPPLYGAEGPKTYSKRLAPISLQHRKSSEHIHVTTTKLENLPAVVERKRIRCAHCNKRLNITNMYDCRCGGIFCSQHRYSEVHGCKYDYKTEGRKLIQRENPLVVADKVAKL